MAPKGSRKSTQASAKVFVPPANAVPQPLPPSVEEAYRRKCCQLRHRYNQIEEHNDAARLRLHRLRRQLDKLRVERAFLLEQIAKRTSANVEDSEGSPSPPPTVRLFLQLLSCLSCLFAGASSPAFRSSDKLRLLCLCRRGDRRNLRRESLKRNCRPAVFPKEATRHEKKT
jgi:hypothetical protein